MDSTVTLKKGDVWYQGDRREFVRCFRGDEVFRMKGQRGKDLEPPQLWGMYTAAYARDLENVAKIYAGCSERSGYIHKFRVREDGITLKMADPYDFYDVEETGRDYCDREHNVWGIYLAHIPDDPKSHEIQLCLPEKHLEYLGSKRCDALNLDWMDLRCDKNSFNEFMNDASRIIASR